ncbi:hypothetical protein ACVW00_000682 [Marmoricola sp. URHA0025 HA25]
MTTGTPGSAPDPLPPTMSADEIAMWTKAADDLAAPQVLARIAAHDKAVVSTVGTVGTLLAGLGGVTAAISITRGTFYLHGLPVVPVGALATSLLAGLAVGVALFGSRPEFAVVNTHNLLQVKKWYAQEVDRGKTTVQIASGLFIGAAFVAAATSAVAGVLAVTNAQTDPRNLAALSTTAGDKGAVTVHLSGAVDGLDKDEHLLVAVTGDSQARAGDLISVEVYPDADGKATLDAEAQAPVGSTKVVAAIWVLGKGETADGATTSRSAPDFGLTATYPEVPEPEKPAPAPAATG